MQYCVNRCMTYRTEVACSARLPRSAGRRTTKSRFAINARHNTAWRNANVPPSLTKMQYRSAPKYTYAYADGANGVCRGRSPVAIRCYSRISQFPQESSCSCQFLHTSGEPKAELWIVLPIYLLFFLSKANFNIVTLFIKVDFSILILLI